MVAPPPRKRVTNHIWILTAIVCLIVVLAMLGWRWASFTTSGIRLAYTVVPLETEPGFASSPTFSPDGRQIAFSWNGKKQDNFDIYVKIVGSFEELRLTDTPEIEFSQAGHGRSLHRVLSRDRTGRYVPLDHFSSWRSGKKDRGPWWACCNGRSPDRMVAQQSEVGLRRHERPI